MLALVVFLNGMAVMVLEMVGARLLAPWLGTSVVVWTSLIGVILACLSLGYWLGGRLADSYLRPVAAPKPEKKSGKARRPAPKADNAETPLAGTADDDAAASARAANIRAVAMLSNLLAGASVTVFITAMLQGVMLPALAKAVPSLHLAAVLAALLLFALPSMLCGMVSPYAVRLAITDSETSGAVIGRLNAVSTVGSIVGTFLGGFVLISWFGSMETTLGVSAILLATAALVRLKPALSKVALALCLVLAAFAHKSYTAYMIEAENAPIGVDTLYSSVRVADGLLEGRPVKLLFTDPGSCQSASFVDTPAELAFAYTKFYALGTSMNPAAKRILMLGGGGYSVPKWLLAGRSELASPDFSLDVVELDPGITDLARKYFQTPTDDPRMRVFHEDARTFVNRTAAALPAGAAGPYNLIFADIFNSYYSVPFHVGTVEAAQKVHALLAEDGIYIMNIITAVNGDNGRLLRSIRNAFAEVFGEVHLFPVQSAYDGTMVQNVMLLAFRTPRPLPDAAKPGLSPHIASMLSHRWTSPLPPSEKDVPPLRDNFAPVERYTLGFH